MNIMNILIIMNIKQALCDILCAFLLFVSSSQLKRVNMTPFSDVRRKQLQEAKQAGKSQ